MKRTIFAFPRSTMVMAPARAEDSASGGGGALPGDAGAAVPPVPVAKPEPTIIEFLNPAKIVSVVFRGQTFHLEDGKLKVTDPTAHETQELIDKGFRVQRPADVQVSATATA